MVATVGDRIDGWWSRKTAIGDSRRARVLVFMQRGRFPIERNGARKEPRASTPDFTLDTAVVVIEGMTEETKNENPMLAPEAAANMGHAHGCSAKRKQIPRLRLVMTDRQRDEKPKERADPPHVRQERKGKLQHGGGRSEGGEHGVRTPTSKHAAKSINYGWQPFRDVLLIMLDTGMRPAEVFRMRWEHVRWERELIFVPRSKSRKSKRFVGITERVRAALLARKTDVNEGWVFPSARARSGHLETVQKQFERAKRLAGLPESVVLYCACHRFSTDAMEGTGNLMASWMQWATKRSIPRDSTTIQARSRFATRLSEGISGCSRKVTF
jgi:hypothetical protein